jgi:hypothetical protein
VSKGVILHLIISWVFSVDQRRFKMSGRHLFWKLAFLLTFLAIIGGATACSEQGGGGPRAWIDYPRDGMTVPAGKPVSIVSHAYAREGVAEVLLSVNGQAYRRDPSPQGGATFSEFRQEWLPEREGDYTLQLKSYDRQGASSASATISVRVVSALAHAPITDTPVPDLPDLAITNVEAIVAGYKGDKPFCNTRVTYRNAGTAAVPSDFTIQFHYNGVPTWATTVAGGLPAGASAEAIFVHQFIDAPYIGINLDSTDVIEESDETNNAFAEARLCSGTPPDVTPTHTPTPTPSITPTPPPPMPRAPTPTFTPTPTRTPPADIRLWADDENVKAGSCTTVHWHVSNVKAYWVDGNAGAGDDGGFKTCPCQAETHTLRAAMRDGSERNLSVTVNVSGQCQSTQDTTPPSAPSPLKPQGTLECVKDVMLRWTAASDKSGIAGYYVKLEREIKKDQWQTVRGWWPVNGEALKVDVDCGIHYRWAVRAQDGAGNTGDWSKWSEFSIALD